MSVCPVSIGGRLTMESISAGFVLLGADVTFFDEMKEPPEQFKKLTPDSFDYVLGYDFSAIRLKTLNGLNFKTINYFSDVIEDPHSGPDWQKYYPYLNDESNFTFYWDFALYEQKKSEIKNLFYLPHFVNCDIYKNLHMTPEYDVMFAGRLDTQYRLDVMLRLLKRFEHNKIAWFAIQRHFDDAISRCEIKNSRCESDYEKNLLKKAYKGFIDNEKDMATAINKTKIVFNMNEQGISSLNYRTFQVMACEKLLISDYRSELETLFGSSENYVYYRDLDDLEAKIDFFLSQKSDYLRICANARRIVEQKYDSRAGAAKILQSINS